MTGTKPYGELKFKKIKGKKMAYIDQGQGDAIVFQHGNPTSSYLWRNVMPHVEGQGRLIACDLIGMGDSEKLENSGPDRYSYQEQREYLFALWDELDLGNRVILVIHDWGGALGFDWANKNRDRVAGIVHMETVSVPMEYSDFPPEVAEMMKGFRSPQGEAMVLDNNVFIEGVLPAIIQRTLSKEEMDHYRRPYLNSGEDRRPTLSWPRAIPIGGEPADVVETVRDFGKWLATSDVPKLFIRAEPGVIQRERVLDVVRSWPNQTEVTVAGTHFIQEDSADDIGKAISTFVSKIRGKAQ